MMIRSENIGAVVVVTLIDRSLLLSEVCGSITPIGKLILSLFCQFY